MTPEDVTPSEYLVMEVLAARHRLGEAVWTFPKRIGPVLSRLEGRGLIGFKDGIAEGTDIAWLTAEGIVTWALDQPYTPPSADADNGLRESATSPPFAAPVDARFCVLCLNGDHDREVHNAALDGGDRG